MFQRPQHLMTRFARSRRVFFVEEPLFDGHNTLSIHRDGEVFVSVPHLRPGLTHTAVTQEIRRLLQELMLGESISNPVLWYYTPMALEYSRGLRSSAIVFDCMDELSAFDGAPADLLRLEAELLERADLVFTGGISLFEAKRERHPRMFPFPSSVDIHHFARARERDVEPIDQQAIPHPRIGFFGVIDERMDFPLLQAVAEARPNWQLVLLGPFAKINPAVLPRQANIHYLGMKTYDNLPRYLSGWDAAILPFARNRSTQFISPTKTPEYLAAGCPVVSTSVRDVVRPYGEQGLVEIADEPGDFVAALERALEGRPEGWHSRVDTFLSRMSWDATWLEMSTLIDQTIHSIPSNHPPQPRSETNV